MAGWSTRGGRLRLRSRRHGLTRLLLGAANLLPLRMIACPTMRTQRVIVLALDNLRLVLHLVLLTTLVAKNHFTQKLHKVKPFLPPPCGLLTKYPLSAILLLLYYCLSRASHESLHGKPQNHFYEKRNPPKGKQRYLPRHIMWRRIFYYFNFTLKRNKNC